MSEDGKQLRFRGGLMSWFNSALEKISSTKLRLWERGFFLRQVLL